MAAPDGCLGHSADMGLCDSATGKPCNGRSRLESASTAYPSPMAHDFPIAGRPWSFSELSHFDDDVLFTPPVEKREVEYTTPQPPGPRTLAERRRDARSGLLKALMSGSLSAVTAALESDSAVATEPFFDNNCEPPLCAAVNFGCPADVLALLLRHGADVHSVDCRGRTPLLTLCSLRRGGLLGGYDISFLGEGGLAMKVECDNVRAQGVKVAELLLDAGADPWHLDVGGFSAADLARHAGNDDLVEFLVSRNSCDVSEAPAPVFVAEAMFAPAMLADPFSLDAFHTKVGLPPPLHMQVPDDFHCFAN